jgi:VanZ family protein
MVPSTLNDKANHVIAYFTLSFLYDISFASGLFPKGCFYLFLYGVLMEIIQYFIPGREFSFLDMGANGAGIVLFVLMSRIFRRRFVTQ